MNDQQAVNLEVMQRADEANALRGLLDARVGDSVRSIIGHLVAHYRSGAVVHDTLVGKVAEISALMALMASFDADVRAGDAARDREFGDGKAQQQSTTPGTRSRSKST
jgi:hypothetical protein